MNLVIPTLEKILVEILLKTNIKIWIKDRINLKPSKIIMKNNIAVRQD